MSAPNSIRIIRGTDHVLNLTLQSGGVPFDLSQIIDIKALFVKENNQVSFVSYADGEVAIVGDPAAGQVTMNLSRDVTAQLRVGIDQMFEVELTMSDGKVLVAQFADQLAVTPRLGGNP